MQNGSFLQILLKKQKYFFLVDLFLLFPLRTNFVIFHDGLFRSLDYLLGSSSTGIKICSANHFF